MLVKLKAPFYEQHWDKDEWKKLGFQDEEEALYWKKSSCGILCLKMALDGLNSKESQSIAGYIRKGIATKAYTHANGWSHDGLARIARQMGAQATAEKFSIQDLKNRLNNGYFPIISIKPDFETDKSLKEKILFWKKYGGHMALVAGYEEGEREGFLAHHTSRRPEYNGPYIFVPLKRFRKTFTGRGVVVCKNFGRK